MADTGVAVVGYGYWGMNLVRNVHAEPNCTLVGVVESSSERRDAVARAYPDAIVWSSLDAALEDSRVLAVVIATPARTHARLALKVLSAGRHVLVEKPLAMTTSDAAAVQRAAVSAGLVAMVGHTFLYSVPVRRLRQYLHDGRIGNVNYLYSQRLNLGRIRSDCDALWNFAPHDLSIMLYLLGERPVEVSARGFSFLQEGINDVSFASLEFESGVAGHLHVSWLDPRKVRLMTVVGSTGMAVYDDVSVDHKLSLYDSAAVPAGPPTLQPSLGEHQWQTRAGDLHMPKLDLAEPLLQEISDFVRCCRTGEVPVASAEHGVEVVRVLEAIDASTSLGGAPVRMVW